LDVDHVARTQIALMATDYFGKLQQARIGLPGRPRVIAEIETLFARGNARDGRLEKHVKLRLRDETRHEPKTVTSGHVSTRVCLRGKRGNNLHPAFKPHLHFPRAMQKLVETLISQGQARFARRPWISASAKDFADPRWVGVLLFTTLSPRWGERI
jgi:hypothetical protein